MKIILLILFLLTSSSLYAAAITASNAIITVLPPGSQVTAITFDLKNNTQKDITLFAVSGDFADSFEIHTMGNENGKMKMKKLDQIILKKNSTTELKKGGNHIMVFDPKENIQENKTYNLTLHYDKNKKLNIKVVGKKTFDTH